MGKRVLLVLVTVPMCAGTACDFTCITDGIFDGVVELDRADCIMTIRQSDGASEATVTATITDDIGLPFELTEGQAVSVNGQPLLAGGAAGAYTRSLPIADSYTVTVNEPTRGVEDTVIAVPGASDPTSPADGGSVSLSGFTLTWSNANANQQVRITLTQTLFGQERREEFGPVIDTGSMVFGAGDLGSFQQGANLAIALIRINEQSFINGFNTGELTVERSKTLLVAPGP